MKNGLTGNDLIGNVIREFKNFLEIFFYIIVAYVGPIKLPKEMIIFNSA